ncbi:MAG: hypothetical protein U1E65_05890 [Myxococcota bacterium]
MAKRAITSEEEGEEERPLAPPPTDRLTQRVLAVTEAVGAFIEAWGFRAIHGKVWCLLALRRAPTHQSDIAEILGVSRSLVNLAIAELTQYGLVRAVGDHRNAPYEACLDVWPTISDVLRGREWMLIERARLALEAAIEEGRFAKESGERSDYDLSRMRMILAMTELAQTVLRMVLALRVPRSLDGFGEWLKEMTSLARRFRR